ncbi:MAG TPA: hypothetical protein VLL52_00175 [Anaerolineae bacterium]|nr:hypothetical protein [Anaerolineae bacterium]
MVLNKKFPSITIIIILLLTACTTTSDPLPTLLPTAAILPTTLPATLPTNPEPDNGIPPTYTPAPTNIPAQPTLAPAVTFTPRPTIDVAALATYSLNIQVTPQLPSLEPDDSWLRAINKDLGLVVYHHPDIQIGSFGRSLTLAGGPDLPVYMEIRNYTADTVNLPVPFDTSDPQSLLAAMRREFPTYLDITILTPTSTLSINDYNAATITFNAQASLDDGDIDVDYYIGAISHLDRVLTFYGTTPGGADDRLLQLLRDHTDQITITPLNN